MTTSGHRPLVSGDRSRAMDGISAIRSYVDRIVTGDGRCSGMKVLLLDASTTQSVSCVYSQSEILSREVYLVSRLDDSNHNPQLSVRVEDDGRDLNSGAGGNRTSHLKAVCYLRPTDANAGLLMRELSCPRFSEYHVFFSGVVPSGILRLLAESDVNEMVRQVQEFYGDYVPANEDLLTLNCRNTLAMTAAGGTSWERDHAHLYDRNRRGVEGMLLSLRRRPTAVRYQRSSETARRLATDVSESIRGDEIFHFRGGSVLLLIVDRCDDPVTPLLSQWTYQAMVHELLGLNNNRVMLQGAPNVSKELEEVVLSAAQDEFFRSHRYSNFGELGEAVKNLLDEYQRTTRTHDVSRLNSVEAMQAFMDKFPELKSQSHTVSKHVAIMGELARLVDVCALMDVSQFEQELACADDHTAHTRELLQKLASPSVKIPDKLRLGLLYALRYEDGGNVRGVKTAMENGGVLPEQIALVDQMLQYAGRGVRGPGLYGESYGPGGARRQASVEDVVSKFTKSILTSVQGVQNVYAQHVPVLSDTINSACRGRLPKDSHPFVMGGKRSTASGGRGGGGAGGAGTDGSADIPEEIIVFMVGGTTYEEATKVHQFNEDNPWNARVILGGSTVHNSTSFLEELKKL